MATNWNHRTTAEGSATHLQGVLLPPGPGQDVVVRRVDVESVATDVWPGNLALRPTLAVIPELQGSRGDLPEFFLFCT